MRHKTIGSVTLLLIAVGLVACGSGSSQKGSEQTREGKAPACGQSKIQGAATDIYDTAQKCADGREALKNKAKDDLIQKCKDYCKFLSDKCEMNPELTRDNTTADDYACDKLQDDVKVHARATAEKDCICKPKA